MFVAKTTTLNKIKITYLQPSSVVASLLAGSFIIAFVGIPDFYGSQHKLAHLVCPCVFRQLYCAALSAVWLLWYSDSFPAENFAENY